MKKIINWLHQISTGWVALAALIVFILFTALVLPQQAEQAAAYSGEAGSPDTSFFYSADQLYQIAEAYGPNGREAYIRARLTFDVVWPLVYVAFLITAIGWLTQQTGLRDTHNKTLILLPILGLVFDFLENGATSVVMARYPSKTPLLASLAGYFTAVKWVFVAASFLVLIGLALALLWKRIRKQR
jgi:hypothetical protein